MANKSKQVFSGWMNSETHIPVPGINDSPVKATENAATQEEEIPVKSETEIQDKKTDIKTSHGSKNRRKETGNEEARTFTSIRLKCSAKEELDYLKYYFKISYQEIFDDAIEMYIKKRKKEIQKD